MKPVDAPGETRDSPEGALALIVIASTATFPVTNPDLSQATER